MANIDAVAKELHMKSKELLKESLKTYLEKRLSKLEADIFLLTKKYGVKDVFDLVIIGNAWIPCIYGIYKRQIEIVFMPYFRGIFHQLRNPRLLWHREVGVEGVRDAEESCGNHKL
ncbi:MAG TPA: hypothetical protein DDX84_09265 [Nitrospiraceae bacterium]|nr:hypothetical protein [Nitrospiraceae bacterium]HBI24367.1 hypothetical protein [Nitrospiraceae bacterium]